MTPEGYEKINATLLNEGLDATVTPRPEEGEDIRYIGIRLRQSYLSSLRVLNVLEKAGLMYREDSRDAVLTSDPQLQPLTVETGAAVFEDKNYRP